MKIKEYELLEQYKKQGRERSEKLMAYQEDLSAARSRLAELNTQYELTFTKSVETGKDATADLTKIDQDIEVQREIVKRRERDLMLVQKAMPATAIDSVEVVRQFRPQFASVVQKEFVDKVNPKLVLARDLIISVLQDSREYSDAYDDVTAQISELVTANHRSGKTQYIESQGHPTDNAPVFGANGATSAVRKLLEQVSQYTYGQTPSDFKYIETAPVIAEKQTKKETK